MTAIEKKKEAFEIVEPNATSVLLVGDFTEWEKNPVALKRQKGGSWRAIVPLDPGAHEYRYLVDGQWRNDEQGGPRRSNPYGGENCVREVAP